MGFENRPIQIPIFLEKVTHSLPICPIFGEILSKITQIFLNLANFCSNLGKIGKIDPFTYQILHFIRVHSYTKRLILLPMLAAHPRRLFCTEYPPPDFKHACKALKPVRLSCNLTCNMCVVYPGLWNVWESSFVDITPNLKTSYRN